MTLPRRRDYDWATASDLAEYAYCPRAWWYRNHPSEVPPSSESVRSAVRGERFHDRELRAMVRRERLTPYLALLVAAVLLVLGGLAWGLS